MIICIVEMRAAPGLRVEFLALCEEGVPRAIRGGCLGADILVEAEEPDVVVLVERWPSDQVFQSFTATEWADAALMAKYRELAVGMPKLRQFAVVLQVGSGQ